MPWTFKEIERITNHVKRFTGVEAGFFHELVPTTIRLGLHIDLHIAPPTKKRNYYTAFTTGMSDQPQNVEERAEDFEYVELMLCLPASWPESRINPGDEKYGWPLRWLRILAEFPHDEKVYLGWGHTIPGADPPEPFGPNTELCCWFTDLPGLFPEAFCRLKLNREKTIQFLALVPIYKEEWEFTLKPGKRRDIQLAERLGAAGVTELIDLKRKNVCA